MEIVEFRIIRHINGGEDGIRLQTTHFTTSHRLAERDLQ